MNKPPRQHGSLAAGRALVVAGCLAVAGANAGVFLSAVRRPYPLVLPESAAAIISIWMVAGAIGLCCRKIWGRYFILLILCLGTIGFSLGGILITLGRDEASAGLPEKLFLAVLIYLVVTLVLTYSHHVKRLTSRVWE